MPIGVIVNSFSILLGGLAGGVAGSRMSESFKANLNMVFGLASMAMGISSLVLMKNMPACIFSLIIGTALGITIHFGSFVNQMGTVIKNIAFRILPKPSGSLSEAEYDEELLTIVVLFCASGTGIYGSLVSGMSGEHSILISKSILDLFTAAIFACTLGYAVPFIAVPQFLVGFVLFCLGGVIYPYTTPEMIDDFKAVGGMLLVANGFRMLKLKTFPVADMIVAVILAMPVSWAWTAFVAPLL